MDSKLLKVVMGVRRSGKTVFSHQLLNNYNYAFANFDDERLAFIEKNDLNYLLEVMQEAYGDFKYILLDEIQNVKGWELFVNRLQRLGKRVHITGSNANLLSQELATHLTGRYLQIEMLPFSFREYLIWNKILPRSDTTRTRGALKRELSNYIEKGGFPEVVTEPALNGRYHRTLYSSILSKDIIARHKIKYIRTFKELATNVISNYSSYITYNKLKNIHGMNSVHTTKNYVDYLSEAYIIYILEKYSPKPKEIMNSPKKVYGIDTGMIQSLALTSTDNQGRLMENVVMLELLKEKCLDQNIELYYWKDYQDKEVDFIIKNGKNIMELVQVTYASEKSDIHKREITSLEKASKLLKCKNKTIITWDYEDKEDEVNFVPLWRWLVERPQKYLDNVESI